MAEEHQSVPLTRPSFEAAVRTDLGYYLLVRQDREPSAQAAAFREWACGQPALEPTG